MNHISLSVYQTSDKSDADWITYYFPTFLLSVRLFSFTRGGREVPGITSDANLKYFLSIDVQLDVSGSQVAFDFFSRRPTRHIDFDKNLFHGLVPGAPRCFAGHDAAPFFEVHRHDCGFTPADRSANVG